MIEDREELPQPHGRDPNDQPVRKLDQPEARCPSHARGLCRCEDDGGGAGEAESEERIR